MKKICSLLVLSVFIIEIKAQQFFGSLDSAYIENATFFNETEFAAASKIAFGSSTQTVFKSDLTVAVGTLTSPGKFVFDNTLQADINGDLQVAQLEVKPSAAVNLLSNKNVTVSNSLTNAGIFRVQNNAALVQTMGSTLSNTGTFFVYRDIPSGNGFRFVGSPINNHPVSGFGVTPTGPNGAQLKPIVGDCNPDSLASSSPYGNILELRENVTLIDNCSNSLWYVKSAGNLNNAQSYAMITTGGQTLTFSGTVNNGNISLTGLTRQSGTMNTPVFGTQSRGWHMVSNPYPSPIEIDPSDLVAMGFDAQSHKFNLGSWITNDPLDPIIVPVGQGFQIRKTTVGGTSIFTVNNSFRTTGAPTFYKKAPRENYLNITITENSQTDNTLIYFYPNATDAFDPEFDANKLMGDYKKPYIYTLIGNEKMSFNAVQEMLPGETKSVPLAFHSNEGGTFTLTFNDVATINALNINVSLEDKLLNNFANVTDGFVYSFTKTTGDANERFVVHFNREQETPSAIPAIANKVSLFPNPSNSLLNVLWKESGVYALIECFDVSGKKVMEEQLDAAAHKTLDVSKLSAGVYTLKLSGKQFSTTKFIKE